MSDEPTDHTDHDCHVCLKEKDAVVRDDNDVNGKWMRLCDACWIHRQCFRSKISVVSYHFDSIVSAKMDTLNDRVVNYMVASRKVADIVQHFDVHWAKRQDSDPCRVRRLLIDKMYRHVETTVGSNCIDRDVIFELTDYMICMFDVSPEYVGYFLQDDPEAMKLMRR